jgi:SSS family solute:Na+ symporter
MPQPHLAALDWIVIGSYFLALVAIGLYYRRFAGRSLDDFFLAGRRNSGWANGVSYAAAMMNADVAPAYSGLTVVTGVFICWWYLTRFGLALFIGAVLFAVFWRRLKLFTVPEFYELRYGGVASNVMRAWVAVRSSLIAMVAWTGTGLLAMYKIAGPVLGISKTHTLIITIPIMLSYVILSGFSGVVATAGVQSLIMLVGSVMLCVIVLVSLGGPAALAAKVTAVAGSGVLDGLPPSEHAVFPAAAALVYLIGSSIGYGGDAAPLGGAMEGQYVLSSKSTREASKMYIVAEVTLFVLLLLVTLPSLGAIVEWPGLRTGQIDREMAYGLLMSKYLPPGMLGLLFVVMLAAVMSTIGSNLTFGAQVLLNDVYRRYFHRQASDAHYLWFGRFAMLFILALSLLVVYNVTLLFDVAVFMLTFSAAELPANWAQWWWWRFNRWGRLAASFGAPVALVAVRALFPDWQWWNQAYLVIAVNTVFWVFVTLVTPPDAPEILDRFYKKGRPLGAWGPVRDRITSQAAGA